MFQHMGNDTRKDFETIERAALRLLAKLIARTGKAAGCLQESPEKFIRPMAGTRGLGQSEEKNRRQLPHANDNGRKGLRAKQTQNLLPQARSQLRYPGEDDGQRFEGGGRVVFVQRLRLSFKMREAATRPNPDDAPVADRAASEGVTLREFGAE